MTVLSSVITTMVDQGHAIRWGPTDDLECWRRNVLPIIIGKSCLPVLFFLNRSIKDSGLGTQIFPLDPLLLKNIPRKRPVLKFL